MTEAVERSLCVDFIKGTDFTGGEGQDIEERQLTERHKKFQAIFLLYQQGKSQH